MYQTSDALVTHVRLLGRLPSGSEAASDTEVLAMASDVLENVIHPALRDTREGFGVKYVDYTLGTAGFTYNTENDLFRIPARAQGGSLIDVTYIKDDRESSVVYVPLEERGAFEEQGHPYSANQLAYTIEGDHVVLLAPDDVEGTLRLRYQLRPSTLVPVSSAMSVTSISAGSGYYDYNGTPVAGWTTSSIFDVIESRPNYDVLLLDQATTNVTSKVRLVPLADSLGIDQGIRTLAAPRMYVCLAGESCVVQAPPEYHFAIAAFTVARALLSLGFPEQSGDWEAKAEAALVRAIRSSEPRTVGQNGVIINHFSALRGRR